MINPLAVIFEQVARLGAAEPGAPTAVDAAGGWLGLLPAASSSSCVCVFGVWIFSREAPRIAEEL